MAYENGELTAFRHAFGCKFEQVSRDPLPDGRKGFAGISATKLCTRSLRSATNTMATRPSRAASCRATVAEIRSNAESTRALGAGWQHISGHETEKSPIRAPGRQDRTVNVRPSGAVTRTRTIPETTQLDQRNGLVFPTRHRTRGNAFANGAIHQFVEHVARQVS